MTYKAEYQAIYSTYIEPDGVSGPYYWSFVMSAGGWQYYLSLASEPISSAIDTEDGNCQQDVWIINTRNLSLVTDEQIYLGLCDAFYASSGAPTLREE